MCVCVCVCVCERERERERENGNKSDCMKMYRNEKTQGFQRIMLFVEIFGYVKRFDFRSSSYQLVDIYLLLVFYNISIRLHQC